MIRKMHYFGEVTEGKMILSNIGVLADAFWNEIKNHSKNIKPDTYVVMPDHVHGILIVNSGINVVESGHALTLHAVGQQRFQNIGKNTVSSVIGSYKSVVTKHAHRLGYEFAWQSGYYDVVIRNKRYLKNIRKYILLNPEKWENNK